MYALIHSRMVRNGDKPKAVRGISSGEVGEYVL